MKFRTVLIFWIYSYSISTIDSKKGGGGGRAGNSGTSPNVGSRPLGNAGGAPAGNLGGSRPNSFSAGTAGAGKKGGFLSSPTSKVVAAGLAGVAVGAGGYALINAASGSHYFPEYHRTYYYGDRYYSSSGSASNRLVCRYKIDDGDSGFKNMFYEDQTKITEIIYECDTRTETCCDGLDCCKRKDLQQRPAVVVTERRGVPWWGGLLIFIMFVAIFGLAGFCIYSRIKRRKAINSLQPDATYVVESVQNPQDAYGYPAQTQSQGYSAQNQTPYYPPQPGYPHQQYAPPPAPGYPVGQQPYPQMGQPYSNGQLQNFGQPYPQQQQHH